MDDSGPQPRRKRVVSAVAFALLVGAVWFGVTHDWSDAQQTADDQANDQSVGLKIFSPSERGPVPDLAGEDLDGKAIALADFGDKVLVLNVWGSWCGPCRAEAPDLAKVSRATENQAVQFIGIDTRDTPTAGKSFESKFGIDYPSFDDRDGRVLTAFNGLVPITAVPSTIFIDTHGLIAARTIGRVDATTLQGIVDDLLAEQSRSGPTS